MRADQPERARQPIDCEDKETMDQVKAKAKAPEEDEVKTKVRKVEETTEPPKQQPQASMPYKEW